MSNLSILKIKAGYSRFVRNTERVGERLVERLHNPLPGLPAGTPVPHLFDRGASKSTDGGHFAINGRRLQEERQISEGGFAFVWIVRDLANDEQLALKKILCQDSKALAKARREVELLERLDQHPNIVRYCGSLERKTDSKAREVCMLFELCPGGHLLDLLERSKFKLSQKAIIATFWDVCSAVAYLHSLDPAVQHRDLKVENVLLGQDGRFKLCDFGSWSDCCSEPGALEKQELAQLQDDIERYTTMMYRPPEMVDFYKGFSITEKVDIWMLGCILFTLMFNRHPFQEQSQLAIANARYVMPPTQLYSEKLQDLTHWLLSQDPCERPSANALLQCLEELPDPAISLTLPASVVEKKAKFTRLYNEQPVAAGCSHPKRSSSARACERSRPDRFGMTVRGKTSLRDGDDRGCERGKFVRTVSDDEGHSAGFACSIVKSEKHRKRSSRSEGDSGSTPASWDSCLGVQDPAGVWPGSKAAEPSAPWANFDAFDFTTAGKSTSLQESPTSAGTRSPPEGAGVAPAGSWPLEEQRGRKSWAPGTPWCAFVTSDVATFGAGPASSGAVLCPGPRVSDGVLNVSHNSDDGGPLLRSNSESLKTAQSSAGAESPGHKKALSLSSVASEGAAPWHAAWPSAAASVEEDPWTSFGSAGGSWATSAARLEVGRSSRKPTPTSQMSSVPWANFDAHTSLSSPSATVRAPTSSPPGSERRTQSLLALECTGGTPGHSRQSSCGSQVSIGRRGSFPTSLGSVSAVASPAAAPSVPPMLPWPSEPVPAAALTPSQLGAPPPEPAARTTPRGWSPWNQVEPPPPPGKTMGEPGTNALSRPPPWVAF